MILLAIDAGNSTVKQCVLDGSTIRGRWRSPTRSDCTAAGLQAQLGARLAEVGLGPGDLDRMAICSVVPALTTAFSQLGRMIDGRGALRIGANLITGLHYGTYRPETLGADRIANLVAARDLYGAPAIVVDCGTATNFEVLAADGRFLGGAIAPGMRTSLDALIAQAAQLGEVGLVPPVHAIGTSTISCLQSGSVLGHVALVEGLLARIKAEMGSQATVIGTGGLIGVVAEQTQTIDVIDRDLTLQGVRLIAAMNPKDVDN